MTEDLRTIRQQAPLIAAIVICAVLTGVLIARPVGGALQPSARVTIRISVDQSRTAAIDYSEGTPTTIVYYADGTHGDAALAMAGPWTPDKPVAMLLVVAQSSCAIIIDEHLEVTDGAAINRLAVCPWRA